MKRLIAALTVLMLLVMPMAQTLAEAEEAADAAANEAAWRPDEVRYAFEHRMMPKYFYEVPDVLLSGIGSEGLYPLWEVVALDNGTDPYYPEEDYREYWYRSADGTVILQAQLPEPDAATLCYRIYMVYNPASGEAGYYTAESDSFMPDLSFMCKWEKDGTHVMLGTKDVLDPDSADFAENLLKEAAEIASAAGADPELKPSDPYTGEESGPKLDTVVCDQLGFSFQKNPEYPWDYQEGTGITVYTENDGSIPYIIVYQGEDLIMEPFDYIKEQFTPYMQKQYGSRLVDYQELESYEIGGKQLPAGLYTYMVQEYQVEMIRLYDSTGSRTVAYTAKYLSGQGDATLAALDTAIRSFLAE